MQQNIWHPMKQGHFKKKIYVRDAKYGDQPLDNIYKPYPSVTLSNNV